MGKRCAKCLREIMDGGLAYEVRIEVQADFDGVLSDLSEDGATQPEELLQAMAAADAQALMRQVHHREAHLLCPHCRDRFLANPLNVPLPEAW